MFELKESELIELKQSTGQGKDAVESMAAILNKHGKGAIFFGVKDDGTVVGQDISDSTIRNVSQAIRTSIDPLPTYEIEVEQIDGKDVLVVEFNGNEPPYRTGAKYLIRSGTENVPLSRKDIMEMAMRSNYADPWEKSPVEGGNDLLDEDAMRLFYERGKEHRRISFPAFDTKRLLKSLSLTKDGKPTNGAIALFGKEGTFNLTLARFLLDDSVDPIRRKDIKGPIVNLIEEASMFVLDNLDIERPMEGVDASRYPISQSPRSGKSFPTPSPTPT